MHEKQGKILHIIEQFNKYKHQTNINSKYNNMFKRNQQSGSTKQLRRTKLIDSYKNIAVTQQHNNNTNNNGTNKIMLTDLCPQQKAKVGQLVKTLEIRKKQNKALEDKLKQMQLSQAKQEKMINQLENSLKQEQQKQKKYIHKMQQLCQKQQERQQYIMELLEEIKMEKQRNNRKSAQVEQFSMTDVAITLEQGCQVAPKKKKTKEKIIQTQQIQERHQKYPSTSKSFERIMKKPNNQAQFQQYPTNSHHKKSRISHKNSNIRINDEQYSPNPSETAHYHKYQHQYEEEQQNRQEEFDQLAKKWLQLKERNMSKLKQSYKKSKQKFQQQVIPREFGKGIYGYEEESFGPQNHQLYQDDEANQEEENQAINQEQLNKMLKRKNFSASRILNQGTSRSRIGSQQSSKKSYKYIENKNYPKKKNALQQSNASNSNNIDFYQTDLLDLVNSINPK